MHRSRSRIASVIFTTILVFSSQLIKAQELTQEQFEQVQCFVNKLKPYMDASKSEWDVQRTGNDSANRGIEPIRIEHACGAGQPQYGYYTLQQVKNNVRKFSELLRKNNGMQGSSSELNRGSGTSGNFVPADYRQVINYKQQLDDLAQSFTDRLDRVDGLIQTNDPEELLRDFIRKMQDINFVQQDISAANFNAIKESIENIQDAAVNNNQSSFYQGIGALASLYDLKEKKREAEAREAALKQQRRSQMSKIYWSALEKVNEQQDQFIYLAAYEEDQKTEEYYLQLADNMECYKESMLENWSVNSSSWLINNCPVPTKPLKGIPNNLLSEEQKNLQLAEKKYNRYLSEREIKRGAGIELEAENQYANTYHAVVTTIDPKGPAYAAGLREGDKIIGFDELPLSSLSRDEIAVLYEPFKTVNPKGYNYILDNPEAANGGLYIASKEAFEIISDLIKRDTDGFTIDYHEISLNELGSDYMSGSYDDVFIPTQTETEGLLPFREAAISFAAKALSLNPSGENYLRMADFYSEENSVIALSYLLEAQKNGADDAALYEKLKAEVSNDIKIAVRASDSEVLTSFVSSGLDTEVLVEGKNVLGYAIAEDNPDAVQILLNAYVGVIDESRREEFIQETVLEIARQNSRDSFSRIMELGVDLNFTLNGESPQSVAESNESTEILQLLR